LAISVNRDNVEAAARECESIPAGTAPKIKHRVSF
jgi:hypothetical protein